MATEVGQCKRLAEHFQTIRNRYDPEVPIPYCFDITLTEGHAGENMSYETEAGLA